MTKLEALRMVQKAQIYVRTFGTKSALAEKNAMRDLLSAERGLEFEAFFEMGGQVRRTA